MKALRVLAVLALGFLTACGAEPVWAPDDLVERSRYSAPGPAKVTLLTIKNLPSENGAHSALLISAPGERVIFDPAGTFQHELIPERNDVIMGVSPSVLALYLDYHIRDNYYTHAQSVEVPPEVATDLLNRVKAYGAVPKANCTRSISTLLRDTPGFDEVRATWFPNNLQERFENVPGVIEQSFFNEGFDRKIAAEQLTYVLAN